MRLILESTCASISPETRLRGGTYVEIDPCGAPHEESNARRQIIMPGYCCGLSYGTVCESFGDICIGEQYLKGTRRGYIVECASGYETVEDRTNG
jgi:hypothetical protein